MSTQINAGTQLGTIGVDEVLGEGGEPNAPKRRSIEARRPSAKRVGTRALLNIAAAIVFVMSVFPVYWMVNMSFTPNAQIISRDPSFFPWSFTIQNYITAWTREAAQGQTDFPHALATIGHRHARRARRDAAVRVPRLDRRRALPLPGSPCASSSRCSSCR